MATSTVYNPYHIRSFRVRLLVSIGHKCSLEGGREASNRSLRKIYILGFVSIFKTKTISSYFDIFTFSQFHKRVDGWLGGFVKNKHKISTFHLLVLVLVPTSRAEKPILDEAIAIHSTSLLLISPRKSLLYLTFSL